MRKFPLFFVPTVVPALIPRWGARCDDGRRISRLPAELPRGSNALRPDIESRLGPFPALVFPERPLDLLPSLDRSTASTKSRDPNRGAARHQTVSSILPGSLDRGADATRAPAHRDPAASLQGCYGSRGNFAEHSVVAAV